MGLGLGATILVVLVPILLRAYAKAQAGVWQIVEAERVTNAQLRTDLVNKSAEVTLWQTRALIAGWRPEGWRPEP